MVACKDQMKAVMTEKQKTQKAIEEAQERIRTGQQALREAKRKEEETSKKISNKESVFQEQSLHLESFLVQLNEIVTTRDKYVDAINLEDLKIIALKNSKFPWSTCKKEFLFGNGKSM